MLNVSNKYKHTLVFLLLIFGIVFSKFLLLIELDNFNTLQLYFNQPINLLVLFSIILIISILLPFFRKQRFILISILIGNLLFLINNLNGNIFSKSIFDKLNNKNIILDGEITEIKKIGFSSVKIIINTTSIIPQILKENSSEKIFENSGMINIDSKFSFILRNTIENISIYDTLTIQGKLLQFEKPNNLYEINYTDNAFNKYLSGEIENATIVNHKKLETFKIRKIISQLKDKIENIFDRYLTIRSSGFVNAIFLGEKSNLEIEIKNNFKKSGVLHLLAVSGLHVGFLFIFLSLILKNILGLGKIAFITITSIIIIFYILLTGLSPSVIRAGIMVILFLLANPLKRELSTIDILASSGIISLLIDSNQVFSLGFQLTFLAVFSIIFIYNQINNIYLNFTNSLSENNVYVKYLLNKDTFSYKYIITTILISTSITIGTLPLIMYEFGRLNLFSILLNVLLIPLTGIAFVITTLVLISSQISSVFTFFIAYCLDMINNLIFKIIDLNYYSELFSYNYKFNLIETLLVLILILFLVFYKNIFFRKFLLLTFNILLVMLIFNYNDYYSSNLQIYTFTLNKKSNDMIQNSKILRTPSGENILFLDNNVKKNDLRNIIIPYIYNKHLQRIDFLVFLDKSDKFQKKIDILEYFDKHNRSNFKIDIKNVLIYNEDKNNSGDFTIFNNEYLPKMYQNTNFIEIENIKNILKLIDSRIYFLDNGNNKKNLNYKISVSGSDILL